MQTQPRKHLLTFRPGEFTGGVESPEQTRRRADEMNSSCSRQGVSQPRMCDVGLPHCQWDSPPESGQALSDSDRLMGELVVRIDSFKV